MFRRIPATITSDNRGQNPGGKSFVGGGLYMPDAAFVGKIRQEIDYNYTAFLRIVENKKFIAQYGGLDF